MSIRTPRARRRRAIVTRMLFAATVVAAALAAVPASQASAVIPLFPKTVVSLTFDDANANQKTAATILNRYNMDGTFYVPSGYIGSPGYLTLADLNALKAAGHEIGGHTLSHPDLATLTPDEAKRQICNDRAWLTSKGFSVRSFAYPFASINDAAKAAVAACGYNSARGLGDVRSPSDACAGCVAAETMPPADAFETRAPDQVDTSWTLQGLKDIVTRAEARGGWVQLTFHNVCDTGCEISVKPSVLEQFAIWLKSRSILRNTVVQTVGNTVGGAVKPVVNGPVAQPAGPGVNGVSNPGMENVDADGNPVCWMKGGYGSNTAALTLSSAARTGARAGKVAVSAYVDGDAKWLPQLDLGGCAPTVVPGHTYSLRSWYTSSSTVTQFAIYLRDEAGVWHYWTSSPWFAAASSYTQAVWTTPAIPAGNTGISFGLNLFGNGDLVTDDSAIYDTVGAPAVTADAPPTPAKAPAVSKAAEPGRPTESQVAP